MQHVCSFMALSGVSAVSPLAFACELPAPVCLTQKAASSPLIRAAQPALLFVDASADSAVRHLADSFAADVQRVARKVTRRVTDAHVATGALVIIAILGQGPVVDELVRAGKLDVAEIADAALSATDLPS